MVTASEAGVRTYQVARKIVVTVAGVSVILVGIAMIVLPGPAVVVIPAGLALLAAEYQFAKRWLAQVRRGGSRLGQWLRRRGY